MWLLYSGEPQWLFVVCVLLAWCIEVSFEELMMVDVEMKRGSLRKSRGEAIGHFVLGFSHVGGLEEHGRPSSS